MTIQRRAAERLSKGSAEVARRLGRRATSSVGTAIVGGVLAWKGGPELLGAAHQQPLLVPAAAGAWCWAAWRAGGPGAPTEDEQDPAATEEDQAATAAGEFLAQLHQLMPGRDDRLHLAQIAQHLHGDPAATGPVREMCAAAGITIAAVRVKGRGSSTGIYRRDLPPLPDPSRQPLSGVVAAGQSQQQQHQQRIETGGGEGFITLPDPDGNPHRTIVQWTKTDS
ncbi:hypothetical protein [Kitasatospora sp. NPDC059571]|uniref:hypothetical protein n=1 Tax=Kitasatospora sp. NPDC059571 TaxID=3346871 RepID=UPI0036CEED8B